MGGEGEEGRFIFNVGMLRAIWCIHMMFELSACDSSTFVTNICILLLKNRPCRVIYVRLKGAISVRFVPPDAKSTRKSGSAGPSIDRNKAH